MFLSEGQNSARTNMYVCKGIRVTYIIGSDLFENRQPWAGGQAGLDHIVSLRNSMFLMHQRDVTAEAEAQDI